MAWNRNSEHSHFESPNFHPSLDYYLECRDGSLTRNTLKLNDTVENILASMSTALQASGAVVPTPPIAESPNNKTQVTLSSEKFLKWDEFDASSFHRMMWASSPSSNDHLGDTNKEFQYRFDINSRRGRNLLHFLRTLDFADMEERKERRTDVVAAALVARRAYGFQSIDGTRLGWSSSSLAMLLSSLLDLHEEHSSVLKVSSFYPLSLLLSSDEEMDPVDLYGGTVTLHPAATPLQWLQTLSLITDESIALLQRNRQLLKSNVQVVQDGYNIKLKRGYTCYPRDYFNFTSQAAKLLNEEFFEQKEKDSNSQAVALERLCIIVESGQACRRPIVTTDGNIRIGAAMSLHEIQLALSMLATEAHKRRDQVCQTEERCKEIMVTVQQELGLERIYRAGPSKVSGEQLFGCLSYLLQRTSTLKTRAMTKIRETMTGEIDLQKVWEEEVEELRDLLAGKSLGIIASGHFCHLGDDGSLVIPWDCR